jgi:hypothetical protein
MQYAGDCLQSPGRRFADCLQELLTHKHALAIIDASAKQRCEPCGLRAEGWQ